MQNHKIIIVDDERLAREELRRMFLQYPQFEVAGEAENAEQALALIEKVNPEIIFLDIQLPGKSGFDLLEMMVELPEIVFVTAYDQFAVQAFELNALDYLVKPIREERFRKMIEKVEKKLKQEPAREQKKLFFRDGNNYHFVQLAEVGLIESMDNYARLYVDGRKVYVKSSLNQLEEKINSGSFFRANRSQLINTKFIAQVKALPKGKLQILLTNGILVEVSDRQSVKFKKMNGP